MKKTLPPPPGSLPDRCTLGAPTSRRFPSFRIFPTCRRDFSPAGPSAAFTLLELLVATAVFMLLLVLLASVSNQSLGLLKSTRSQAEAFQNGRVALDLIARKISQATVNPYWALDDPTDPTRYLRQSRLRFLIAPTADLLGAGAGPGSAIFFQAPLGRSPDNRQLVLALNTCGFFVQRGTDANHPAVAGLPSSPIRYRLMDLQSTAEGMTAFAASTPGDRTWFTQLITDGEARPVAENVVLLVFRAMRASGSALGTDLTTDYVYDSAANATADPQPATANQLPPFVEITLVAVDDASYARAGEPVLNALAGLFQNVSRYDQDMLDAEDALKAAKLDYRIFRTRVALANSKWSE